MREPQHKKEHGEHDEQFDDSQDGCRRRSKPSTDAHDEADVAGRKTRGAQFVLVQDAIAEGLAVLDRVIEQMTVVGPATELRGIAMRPQR